MNDEQAQELIKYLKHKRRQENTFWFWFTYLWIMAGLAYMTIELFN